MIPIQLTHTHNYITYPYPHINTYLLIYMLIYPYTVSIHKDIYKISILPYTYLYIPYQFTPTDTSFHTHRQICKIFKHPYIIAYIPTLTEHRQTYNISIFTFTHPYINACFPNLHIYLTYTLKSIHLNHIRSHTLYSYTHVHIHIKIFFHTIPMHTQTSKISIFYIFLYTFQFSYLPYPFTSPLHLTNTHRQI